MKVKIRPPSSLLGGGGTVQAKRLAQGFPPPAVTRHVGAAAPVGAHRVVCSGIGFLVPGCVYGISQLRSKPCAANRLTNGMLCRKRPLRWPASVFPAVARTAPTAAAATTSFLVPPSS